MKILIFLISFLILSGCATYIEEANNQQFKPLTPSIEEFDRVEPVSYTHLTLPTTTIV